MKLFNSLGRKLETFEPINATQVKIYSCGPTVYDFQHIGNYSAYIYWDIIVRLLMASGYKVKRVMNITDVGHLMSDGDEGEDKLEKSAEREGKTAREVADFYMADFLQNIKSLNLVEPETYAKATDFIETQLEIIKILIEKGFAYQTEQAIYFDVSKLPDYGLLAGQKLDEKETAARPEVITDAKKRNSQDFGLWFYTVGRFANHEMHWPSDWGEGFPGWHIECSAIIHALLGEPIDIHTGGVEHLGTHHPNEIAQTKAAFGKPLAKFWLHNNHMMVDGKKMSKSLGNFLTLKDLASKGYEPVDFKMLVLQSHYRSQSNFTWEALDAAKTRLKRYRAMADLRFQNLQPSSLTENTGKEILTKIGDDLGTPQALVLLDDIAGGPDSAEALSKSSDIFDDFLADLDNLFGLGLTSSSDITAEQKSMIKDRESARQNKNWQLADELRDKLAKQGLELNDTPSGTIWSRT